MLIKRLTGAPQANAQLANMVWKVNGVDITTLNAWQDYFSIETSQPRDMVDYNIDTHLTHWYDDNYLVSGYQYIVNKGKGAKAKRFVFFLNKIIYE